jgi:hypothetical protein
MQRPVTDWSTYRKHPSCLCPDQYFAARCPLHGHHRCPDGTYLWQHWWEEVDE